MEQVNVEYPLPTLGQHITQHLYRRRQQAALRVRKSTHMVVLFQVFFWSFYVMLEFYKCRHPFIHMICFSLMRHETPGSRRGSPSGASATHCRSLFVTVALSTW